MDKLVTVSRDFLNQIRGFLNVYAGECRGCLRKAQYGCIGCEGLRATLLIKQIDNLRDMEEEKYYQENPLVERYTRVIAAIKQARRPLSAKEILLPEITKIVKEWTLRKMCAEHMIRREKVSGSRYVYSIDKGLPKSFSKQH